MATSTTTALPTLEKISVTVLPGVRPYHRRRISPDAGRALEKLGHAIDYLTDEYIHEQGSFRPGDARLQAVELLKSINRSVYFACPEVPTVAERVRSWFEGQKHQFGH